MTDGGHRWGATQLVLGVLVSWLLATLLAAVGLVPRAQAPSSPPPAPGGPVVVVGVPGLTWDLVDPTRTPSISDLAAEGGAAALVLRGAHETTCAADAWLTLGAGQRAATDVEGCVDAAVDGSPAADRPAAVAAEDVVSRQGRGAVVDEDVWQRWSRAADRHALATELGTLAAEVAGEGACVTAYDPLAALAAADPQGRVTSYRPGTGTSGRTAGPGEPGTLPTDLDPTCEVHLMTTVPVGSDGPGDGAGPGTPGPVGVLSEVDRAVGTLVAGLPDRATVLLAGLGHVDGRAGATMLVVHPVGGVPADLDRPGNGSSGAVLTSGSTQQRSLVQLTDLTATVLQLMGVEGPLEEAVAGQPVVAVEEGSDEETSTLPVEHVEDARDLAAGITVARVGAPWVLGTVAVVLLVLLAASVVRRRRQRMSVPPGGTGGLAVVATAVMAVPAATFLTGLVPWWWFVRPVVALSVGVLVVVGLLTALAWAGPWRRAPLGPAAVVAAVTLAVVGSDVVLSARLGLVSVLGLQPVSAGRFYGQGNVGFGIVLGSFLVLAAAVIGARPATRSRGSSPAGRPAAAGAVLALGSAAVLLNAAPQAGADFGGVPALVVATGLMGLAALGIRWSAGALILLGVVGLGVAGAVMVLDWTRGPGRRTHLGDFVERVLDGTAPQVVVRKLDQSLGILLTYPLSWLAVLALVLLALAVWRRPGGWTAPLWRHEGMHRALVVGVVATTLGWVLNDSGIAVVSLALTVLLAAALTLIGSEPSAAGAGADLQLVPGSHAAERPGDGPPSAVQPRHHG